MINILVNFYVSWFFFFYFGRVTGSSVLKDTEQVIHESHIILGFHDVFKSFGFL